MGGKGGGGGRKMAAARTKTTAAAAAEEEWRGGGGGPRQRVSALLVVVAAAVASSSLCLSQVSAVDVYTPAELSVENGTEAKLPCTFASSEVISSAASVTWSFQAEGSTTSVSFFYYSNGRAYPGQSTQFKDRSSWAGDLNKKDASINIANMQFQDNGTYICDVKNPPDIVVTPGEIKVRVVERGIVVPGNLPLFTPTLVAGISIGGVLGLSLLIILIVCVVYRKKNSKKHYSGDPDIDARLGM